MRDEHRQDMLETAVLKLQTIIQMQQARQLSVVKRINLLYKISFIAFAVLVTSISFLVILLALEMPKMTQAITTMNGHFANITKDMEVMRQSMDTMQDNVDSLPMIVQNIDMMHSNTAHMSGDVGKMRGHMSQINSSMYQLSFNVNDMSQSFQSMDHSVARMRSDVNHMSAPMRLFNDMNPFW